MSFKNLHSCSALREHFISCRSSQTVIDSVLQRGSPTWWLRNYFLKSIFGGWSATFQRGLPGVACNILHMSDKGQASHWSSLTCYRISRLVGHLVVTKLKQLLDCPISDFFSWHPNTFCPYRPILTRYHQEPNSTVPYWPSATKYQPLLPFTDSIPPCSNDFCTVYPGSSWYNYQLTI